MAATAADRRSRAPAPVQTPSISDDPGGGFIKMWRPVVFSGWHGQAPLAHVQVVSAITSVVAIWPRLLDR